MPPAPPPPPMLPTPALSEEELRPLERPTIVITDLDEITARDQKVVSVTGTLVNRGTGATREVYVHVEALNRDGTVVVSADSDLIRGVIPPGATTRFSVVLENCADIDRYHVEALAR